MTAQTDYFCVQFSELGNSIAYKIYNNVGRENRKYIFLFLHKNVERYISNNNLNISKTDLFQAFAIFAVALRIMKK